MPHQTIILEKSVALLSVQHMTTSIINIGSVYATICDYVYRSDTPQIDDMNYWEYLAAVKLWRDLRLRTAAYDWGHIYLPRRGHPLQGTH